MGKGETRRVLVTGAAGFLGSRLVAALARQGRAVRALVRRTPAAPAEGARRPNVEIVRGDLRDRDSLQRAVDGVDTVLHAAATQRGPWQEFVEASVRGTASLLELALAAGVRRFVQVSSIAVYDVHGAAHGVLVGETHPWEPRPQEVGPYCFSKIETEKLALAWREKGLPVTIVRPGVLFGPGGRPLHPSIGSFLTGRLFVLVDGGKGLLPLVFVDHAVDAILRAAESETAAGQVYNLVDDVAVTRKQYLDRYRAATGASFFVVSVPLSFVLSAATLVEPLRKRGILPHASPPYGLAVQYGSVRIDAGKARRELGWRPLVGLDEGMDRTFAALRPPRYHGTPP